MAIKCQSNSTIKLHTSPVGNERTDQWTDERMDKRSAWTRIWTPAYSCSNTETTATGHQTGWHEELPRPMEQHKSRPKAGQKNTSKSRLQHIVYPREKRHWFYNPYPKDLNIIHMCNSKNYWLSIGLVCAVKAGITFINQSVVNTWTLIWTKTSQIDLSFAGILTYNR